MSIGARDPRSFGDVWQLFGHTGFDEAGTKIGSVTCAWTDSTSDQLPLVRLASSRLPRRARVVPGGYLPIDDHDRSMTSPYRVAASRAALPHNADVNLKTDQEREDYTHYGNS